MSSASDEVEASRTLHESLPSPPQTGPSKPSQEPQSTLLSNSPGEIITTAQEFEPLSSSQNAEQPIPYEERVPRPYAASRLSETTDLGVNSSPNTRTMNGENTTRSEPSASERSFTTSAKGSRDVISDCPYPDIIRYSVRWYFHRSAPKLHVCSHCFSNHIKNTVFASSFDSEVSAHGEARTCRFPVPRMQQLWSKSKSLNNLEAMIPFIQHRAEIQACHGASGVNSTAKVKWFSPIDGAIPGFVACEACYEDYILASSFAGRFALHKRAQTSDAIWACDLSLKAILRAFSHCSKAGDWKQFTSFASMRLNLPNCISYEWLPTTSVKWYQPKNLDFIMCETCYVDSTAFTSMEKYFEPRPDGLLRGRESWLCYQGWITMKIAWEEALDKRGYSHWFEQAQIMATNLLCTASPVKHEKWFVLANGYENFHLCPSCYSTLIASYGYAPHFKEQKFPQGVEITCNFFPTVRHAGRYLEKLSEAVFVDDFSLLKNEIMTWAKIPPCPRLEGAKERNFYGTDDFLICLECYEEVAKGTALESKFTYRNNLFPKANKCDLYSPRMRALWADACAKNDWDGFVLICRQRREVYWQTIPVINNILSQQRIRLSRQKMLNASSNFYNFLNSTTAPSSQINYTGYSQPVYSYGAADVGYGFETQFGVEGARLGQQASSLGFTGRGDIARATYLEEVWKAVE